MSNGQDGRSMLLKLFRLDRGLTRTPPWRSDGGEPAVAPPPPQITPQQKRRRALLKVFGLDQALPYDPPWKR